MTTPTPHGAMPELMACPFCGGKAAVVPRAVNIALQKDPSDPKFGVSIICAQCSSETANMVDEAHAAAKWNTRAAIQQAAGAVPEGWISVTERLPEEWAEIDATPCVLNGKPIGTMYTGMQVLVSLSAGGVQLDNLVCIGEDGKPWWSKYGERVTHWREKPLSALAASPAIEAAHGIGPAPLQGKEADHAD